MITYLALILSYCIKYVKSNQAIAKLIELYRSELCLWHVKCKDLNDRAKEMLFMEISGMRGIAYI